MHASRSDGLRAIEAYRSACGTRPLLEREGRPGSGVTLYHWALRPVREAQVPCTREVTLTVHLGGSRRVRVFTEQGLSRRYSRPGDITLIPSGQSIRYLVDGGAEFATVHLPEAAAHLFLDRTGADLLSLSECMFAFRDEYLLANVRALVQSSQLSGRAAARYSAQMLESLTMHLSHVVTRGNAECLRLAQTPVAPSPVGHVINFNAVTAEIDARISEPISIRELAEIAGTGRSSFCEHFKDYFGVAPHRYILDRRISHAKQLLNDGAQTLTHLAYELGFSSAAHFSTAFKNATGLSPRAFAQRQKLDG